RSPDRGRPLTLWQPPTLFPSVATTIQFLVPAMHISVPIRRARCVLAWMLAMFTALQLALSLAIENLPVLRDPEFGLKLRRLRAQTASAPPLALLLGSSKTGTGIVPDCVELTSSQISPRPCIFNFALCRSGPLMELLCLR